MITNDEQGPGQFGVPPDAGYMGFPGPVPDKGRPYTAHDIRKTTLWGNLLGGGAGVEYFFGHALPHDDLLLEDFRSRDRTWDYCRIALEFFRNERIPFWEMGNRDDLAGNPGHDNWRYCFAKPDDVYLVYLPNGGEGNLDLSNAHGEYSIRWFNPRTGGTLLEGSVTSVWAGGRVNLGSPPGDASDDWLVVVRR
ncbi:MAG: putative collagen-binding domain-containing protein [Opitutaceae bacterium]